MIFYILDSEEKIVETIQSPEEEGTGGITALDGIVEEKLDSYELLELTVPADSDGLENILEEMTIIFKDISGWREYSIYEIEDEDGSNFNTVIRAELSSSELIDEIIEEDYSGISTSPKIVLDKLLQDTRYKVGNIDSSIYSQAFNVNTEYMNVLEAINEFASNYNAEIRFSYQVDGNKVVNRFVDVYKTYGEYKGKIFEIDRDITSVKRTVNTENIKTTIIPYSKEIEEEAPEDAPEDYKPETYRIDITDIEWKKSNGDPVDKPKGQNYLVNPLALENWGKRNPDGTIRHKKISMEFDLDNAESIASMAWVQLGRYTQPTVTYELKAIDIYEMTKNEELKHEQILLGDTGGVKDHYFSRPIEIQTRLVEVKRDLFDPRNNDYVFGSSKQIFSVNAGIEKSEEIAKTVDDIEKKFKDYQTTLNGKNKVFRGSNTPVNPIENDIWFRPHPSKQGHTQMTVFNGVSWVIEADSSELEDASRLKFGILDGAEVNVINLIADNITGGQLKLETGLQITNKGVPILSVNSDGEVEFSVKKLTIGVRDVEQELDRIAELEDGKSAYEIAVQNGFKGTETQWLESLKGPQGPRGVQGLQGPEGKQGIKGIDGADGTSSYTHIAYATNNSGGGFSHDTFPNATHIGIYIDDKSNSSDDWRDYEWTLIKGADGTQGLAGPKGEDGRTPYFHTAWANSADGTSGFSTTDSTNKLYLGTYTSFVSADSNNPSDYKWTKIQGPTGSTGPTGPQGRSITDVSIEYYLSTSQTTQTGGSWVTSPPNWVDGRFMWTRTRTKFSTGTDSLTTPVNVTGSRGPTGSTGSQGPTGSTGRGVGSLQTEYYLSNSRTSLTGGSWSTNQPTWEQGKYVWTRIRINLTNPSGVDYTTPSVDTSWEAIDGIQVGGRNLFSVNQYVSLRNSEGTTHGNGYSVGSSGALVVDGVDGSGGYDTMKMVDLKANTEYIFTFNIPINDRFSFYDTDGVAVSVAKKWSSNNTQLTFKMGNVDGYIGGKFYPIEQSYPAEIYLMAEKGNKATDWTPAPEDIDDKINQKSDQTTVDEINENLSNLETVTATREELGEVLSTLNDYKDMIEANEIDVNDARTNIADLLGRVPLLENNLSEWVEQWNFLDTYVRLGDEGLLIQEKTGSTGIRITTNRIDFLDGRGEPVAYITNQVMRINRGIFVDSAQIGEHKIETIAGGHTIWTWIPPA